jgi:hypothetical protein
MVFWAEAKHRAAYIAGAILHLEVNPHHLSPAALQKQVQTNRV